MHDSDQVYCCNIGTLQFCVAVTFQIGQVAHRTHNSINQRQNKSVTQFDFSKAAAAVISLARPLLKQLLSLKLSRKEPWKAVTAFGCTQQNSS